MAVSDKADGKVEPGRLSAVRRVTGAWMAPWMLIALHQTAMHSVCTYCHGWDSLFRYKYFHGKASREKYPQSR